MKSFLTLAASFLAMLVFAPLACALTATPSTTEGPFYTLSSANAAYTNPSANGSQHLLTVEGTDNDLLHIYADGTAAAGTVSRFSGKLLNTAGTPISGATIELWQSDNNGVYMYVSGMNNYAGRDRNYQGFGKTTTAADGYFEFLTIRPGLYTGRIRHHHFKVKINGTTYLTSQFMPADEAAATPNDNVVASLGSSLSLCTYTPTNGSFTFGSASYTGLLVSKDIVINYTPPANPARITANPGNVSALVGNPASFSVTASGDAPLTYQWYKTGVGAMLNGTAATYTIGSVTAASAGSYYCTVTNGSGSGTSTAATLTVTEPFAAYIAQYPSLTATTGAPSYDADNDGKSNAVEWLLGTDPTAADGTGPTAEFQLINGSPALVFTFTVAVPLGSATWAVQTTADPATTWTTAVQGVDGVTIVSTVLSSTRSQVVVTIPTSNPKIFSRLQVTVP